MFYQEKFCDGRWWHRITPYGAWKSGRWVVTDITTLSENEVQK